MSGGGAGEERSGPAGETTRGGGGEQCSAQRTQGLSVRGPGLRPAGETPDEGKKSDFFTVFHFNQTLFYFCIVTKNEISCLICCCFDCYWYNMQFYLFSNSFSSFIYSLSVLYSFHVATVFGCECLHANQISSCLMC